jgi:hypothetical protein
MACFKDAADLHADLEEFPQAIAEYERVADHSLGSNLTKYSVKEYWLRSLLCCLAMGVGQLSLTLAFPLMSASGYCRCQAQLAALRHARHDLPVHTRV